MQEYPSIEKTAPRAPRRIRIRYSNKMKVFLCYVLTWSLALGIPMAGLVWVYPYKLIGTAPGIAENLITALPFLAEPLRQSVEAAKLADVMGAQAVGETLELRDLQWRAFVAATSAACWLVSLCMQLLWRGRYRHPLGVSRAARRAIRSYRLTLLMVLLWNALGGGLLYLLGIRFIGGRTAWDWAVYMNGFGLNVAAAFVCFRLAAPPAISGKHSFFKRL